MSRVRGGLVGVVVGASLAFAASCGDDVPPSLVTPCAGSLQGKCGTACASDAHCAQGTFCTSSGTCTADCTPGGNECGPNGQCTPSGRCQPLIMFDGSAGSGNSDGSVPDGCVNVALKLKKTIPTVVLLVDQSGSMTEAFSGGNRWDVLRDSLMQPRTGIVHRLQNDVRFGLALYSSRAGDDNVVTGRCPLLTEVAVGIGNYDAINQVYANADPIDETPTGESLMDVARALIPVQSDGPKVIVLATDGEPDTCAQPNPQNGQAQSLSAARFAHRNDIRTYIISVGEGTVSLGHLQDMANAGQGLTVGGTQNAPYYEASNQAALVRAFNEIINGVRDCKLELNGQVDPAKANEGRATLDGNPLGYNDPNGWKLNNPTEIELVGSACQAIKTGDHDIRVSFPCGVITPIPH
jgi:hypothetical protein